MKKKIMAIAISIALVTIITVGTSLAYFTDTKQVSNTFTVGDVHIALTETNWNSSATHQIVPNKSFSKNPTVTNTGTNSAYIRVKLAFTDSAALDAIFPEFGTKLLADSAFTGFDPTQWASVTSEVKNDIRTITLVRLGVLRKDESTTVFTGLTFPKTMTNELAQAFNGDFNITVTADAIQNYDFADDIAAFNAFDAK